MKQRDSLDKSARLLNADMAKDCFSDLALEVFVTFEFLNVKFSDIAL